MSPVTASSIGSFVREQREQARISIRQLAQIAGVSNPYLSQIERGLRKPSADVLQQIAKGLRISAEALCVQAGILEDRPLGVSVRSVVLGDPDLTERQKQMLIELYDSFRKEAMLAAAAEDADLAGPAELAEAAELAESAEDAELAESAEDAETAELAEADDAAETAAAAEHSADAALAPGSSAEHMVSSPAASR
jgi:transcriptional regulator with XRE-family HTH domain